MAFELDDLEARLGGKLPDAYRDYVHSQPMSRLVEQGYDPKTILILNLELRTLERDTGPSRRFFLRGDGCGNYYFVELDCAATNVQLWAHDPPGIEDHRQLLAEFLNNPVHDPPARQVLPGCLWICRTSRFFESILDPIGLDEWLEVVQATDGVEHVGYLEGVDPFTGSPTRFKSPGLVRVLGAEPSLIWFCHGRARGEDTSLVDSVARALAVKLRANVLTARASDGDDGPSSPPESRRPK